MPYYTCEHCNYSSKLKANFDRHEKSKKHRNKLIELGLIPKETDHIIQNNPALIQNNPQIIQNNPPNNPPIIQNNPAKSFKCDFCPKTFTLHSNKRRHEMYRCRENPDFIDKLLDAKNSKIKKLEKANESLQRRKEEWKKEKDKLYTQVSTLIDKVG